MSNAFRDKLLSIGVIGKRSERPIIKDGRTHPETGLPYKSTTTEWGTVTEHGRPGSAVSQRQDVNVTPKIVEMNP